MGWRLLALPGILWSFCAIAVLPCIPASFHTYSEQASSLPNTVAPPGEGRHIQRQTGSTALESLPQPTLSRRRSTRAHRLEPSEISGKKSVCTCDVAVDSEETRKVSTTTEEENILYFYPGEEFRGITLELEITYGNVALKASVRELCVRNYSVWYTMHFRALINYKRINRWALETKVNDCTEGIRSGYIYSFNWFKRLSVTAHGSSCWRHSLVPECLSNEVDHKDESHQNIDPESQTEVEENTDASHSFQQFILMVILPMVIVMAIIMVVIVTLLIRRNMASQPRSCDVAGHQEDAIYESLGPEEVQVRQGARYERQNSLYATWTSGGENTPDIVSVQTGSLAGSCDVAGHQDDAIYENFRPEEVQERQGARYERQNSLYGSFTSGAGGENTPGSCNVAGHQEDENYENLRPEEVQVRQGARYERQNSLYTTWTSRDENPPDIVSVHTGSHLGREW